MPIYVPVISVIVCYVVSGQPVY